MAGRGRPSEGVRIEVRIPSDLLAIIDNAAAQAGTTRAAIIRGLLEGIRRACH